MYPHDQFPDKAFLSCGPAGLDVIDQTKMGALLRGEPVGSWMVFEVGKGNILESEPLSATLRGRSPDRIVVDVICDGVAVEIDFYDEQARRTGRDGAVMFYRGVLEEANSGRGWIPAGSPAAGPDLDIQRTG